MADEVGIILKLIDKVSPGLSTIANSNKAFDKTLQETEQRCATYSKRMETLTKDAAALKTAIAESTRKVDGAKTAYKKYGDEVSKNSLQDAIEDQTNLKNQLKDTEYAIRNTQKAFHGYSEDVRKAGNTGGSGSLAAGLKQAGLYKLLTDSVAQASQVGLESMIGQPTASFVSSVISGVGQGAAMGALVGSPVAGAAIGALSGVVSGASQVLGAQDTAFKSYVQDAYSTVTEEQSASLTSGSSIAGGREQKQMAFSTLLGSPEAATSFLRDVQDMAALTNYTYDEITGYAKSLVKPFGTGKTMDILTALSDTSAALSLDSSDNQTMINGLTRMQLTGKTTQEYLNYFTERGVDTYTALAKYLNVDESKIADMVSSGKIAGRTTVEALISYMQKEYGGLSAQMAETFSGMQNNLGDLQDNLDAAMGAGYNEKRKEGLQEQMDFLSGESGQKMQEAYSAIGAWQAELENSKEKYVRDAVTSAMESDEYNQAKAEDDAAEMGRIIMEAKVKGMNEYNASDGAQLALESELALAGTIRDDAATDAAYWDAGYKKSQEFSKGLGAGIMSYFGGNAEILGSSVSRDIASGTFNPYDYGSYAYGLSYVPYDNFPALLHEGERVQTASEARSGGSGRVIQISVTGNTFGGGLSPDEVAEAIVSRVERAVMLSAPA